MVNINDHIRRITLLEVKSPTDVDYGFVCLLFRYNHELNSRFPFSHIRGIHPSLQSTQIQLPKSILTSDCESSYDLYLEYLIIFIKKHYVGHLLHVATVYSFESFSPILQSDDFLDLPYLDNTKKPLNCARNYFKTYIFKVFMTIHWSKIFFSLYVSLHSLKITTFKVFTRQRYQIFEKLCL